jgi:hypothetical protein
MKLKYDFVVLQATIIINMVLDTLSFTLTPEECKEKGFVPAALLCSSCDDLKQFNLTPLYESCTGCCSKDELAEHIGKYAMAELEVCG